MKSPCKIELFQEFKPENLVTLYFIKKRNSRIKYTPKLWPDKSGGYSENRLKRGQGQTALPLKPGF